MAEKLHANLIDSFLSDDREPDFEQLGLKDAVKSGKEVLDRTGEHIDDSFLDGLSGKDNYTELPSDSKSATLLNRMSEKEAASPKLSAGRKAATPVRLEDYQSPVGDDASLMNEVSMTLEQAERKTPDAREYGEAHRNQSDAEILAYVKKLLNQGTPPAKVAAQLEKIAEIELLNKKDNMGMNYLNQNQGTLGMAYLEPNSFMDNNSPAYERQNSVIASETKPFCQGCNKDVKPEYRDAVALCPDCHKPLPLKPKQGSVQTPADCIRQFKAWKAAGIKPRAASVKKVAACDGCSLFKNKTCTLYGLPVVANAKELAVIINKMTPGVPVKSKRAALIAIANNQPMMVEVKKLGSRPIQKTSTRTIESLRVAHETVSSGFDVNTVMMMHKKGLAINKIYDKGSLKVGSVQAGNAVKAFIASLKDKGTKIALSQIDCKLLKQKLGVNNAIIGAVKCADCIYRQDMHCGLTGGTLVTFPGMEKTGKTASAKPTDAVKLLNEYDLVKRQGVGDIEMNTDRPDDIQMGSHMTAGDL